MAASALWVEKVFDRVPVNQDERERKWKQQETSKETPFFIEQKERKENGNRFSFNYNKQHALWWK